MLAALTKRVFVPEKSRGMLAALTLCVGLFSATASGQEIVVGANYPYAGNVNWPGTVTALTLDGAPADALVSTATFGWTATGCSAAVKVKLFRPDSATGTWNFIAERGPFDVTSPRGGAGSPVVQTVALDPPVAIQRHDSIALTNMTACGGPTWATPPPTPVPGLPPLHSLLVSGDVTGSISPVGISYGMLAISVHGSGVFQDLVLEGGRFTVGLTATDPRTGKTAAGAAHALTNGSGYFSLPELTGDPTVPEVVVKMVDATTAPPPFGGAFWFFYSSLTDTVFTLTVTDTYSGHVRTYASAGSPAFCGAGDTNAFPP
jgi:hypothetical protein